MGQVGTLRCPTLYIHSAEDSFISIAHSENLHRKTPDSIMYRIIGSHSGIRSRRTYLAIADFILENIQEGECHHRQATLISTETVPVTTFQKALSELKYSAKH